MWERIFPPCIGNTVPGSKISLWFFYLFTTVTVWRSQHHIFSSDGGAQSIATIPLDTYPKEAADTIVGIFALWGLSQFILALIYVLACIRYNQMIPLLLLLAIIEYLFRLVYIMSFKSIHTVGNAPGAMINLPLVVILCVMFVLSTTTTGVSGKKPKKKSDRGNA